MASLVIRNLDEGVKARLRVRAAENGRSMEAEAREILGASLDSEVPAQGFGTYLRSFVSGGGFELEIPRRDDESARHVDFAGSEFDVDDGE